MYGETIKYIRENYNGKLSQKELAEKIGASQGNISSWENNAYPPLDASPKGLPR